MSRIGNFLYNLDRAIASLFGAHPQATISSEVGRAAKDPGVDLNDVGAKILNKIDPGHTDDAIKHTDALKKTDEELYGK